MEETETTFVSMKVGADVMKEMETQNRPIIQREKATVFGNVLKHSLSCKWVKIDLLWLTMVIIYVIVYKEIWCLIAGFHCFIKKKGSSPVFIYRPCKSMLGIVSSI